MTKCLGVLLLLLLGAGPLSAQNTIRGRVIDENDNPVPNIQVLLHRVTKAGGGGVATDTSDATGAFTLTAPPDTDTSAIYFVAVQEGGELFMGEMQRLPFPDSLEYIIEAGDEPVQLGEPSAPLPPAPEDRRAGLYVVMAGLLVLSGVFFLAMRRRPPEHRRVLVQLAQLPDDDQGEAVARRRRQLYARLKRDT